MRAAEYAERPEEIVEPVHHELDALGNSREKYYRVEKEAEDDS